MSTSLFSAAVREGFAFAARAAAARTNPPFFAGPPGLYYPTMSLPDWLTATLLHPAVLLSAGGAAGTNARYWLGRAVTAWQVHRFPGLEFPWGTFAINVSGSAALGLVAAAFLGNPDVAHRRWFLLLGTGFCGGYTTFSTFSLETMELLRDDRPLAAVAYALGSVAAGLVAVWAALKLGERV
jgi:CrcB protein